MQKLTHDERFAVIVGGSSGIGLAVGRLLSESGTTVVLISKCADKLREAQASIIGRSIILQCDISDRIDREKAVSELEKSIPCVDYLVISSGILANSDFMDMDEDHWDRAMNTNLKGSIFLLQSVLPLIENGIGRSVVLVSSLLAHVGAKGYLAYCASKGGLSAAVRVLALELAEKRIRVNSVSPGHVNTNMILSLFLEPSGYAEINKLYPIGRIGQPEDVAALVSFLLMESSSWITGADYTIDGGRSAQG